MRRPIQPVLAFTLAVALAGCALHPTTAAHDGGPTAHAISDDGHGNYTIAVTRFTIAPGEERYACQDFANPFGGASAAIGRFSSHLTPGTHHMLLFYKPGAGDGARQTCSGTEFAPGPYGSQRPDDELVYPDGVAAVVSPTDGFRVQVHVLNATPAPLDVDAQITLTRNPGDAVRDHAAVLFFTNTAIDIPANAHGVTAQKTCILPFAVNLVQATGHMHQHGRSFVATSGGTTLFSTASWSDPMPATFAPPIALAAGSAVTFTCTYDNDGATPLTYGDSARDNEMCIFTAQFYPAPFGGWTCL